MSTKITFGKFKIKGADLGERSCLPDIKNDEYIRAPLTVMEEVTEEERKNLGKGMIPTLLPYHIENGYNRERKDLEFDCATLENEYLKATFVTELGGRLWSLIDKKTGRELLYANDVFQPGNLALRNAWFSGGVEWNMGIKGHNPLTCSPLFTERLTGENGEEMLRMYEMERIRECAYSIVAKLEKDVLLVNVTLENTSDKDKYMYWWSNIAVPETKEIRVIAPARRSFWCAYEEGAYYLGHADIPINNGVDVSYSTNLERARDFFFQIPENEKKWITAVDETGYGLVHLSTNELIGRKLFAWGQGQGGKHWNEWLSDSGKSYIEIQAGLLPTQYEHFLFKAGESITWTEGYGALCADPKILHGSDFDAAVGEVKNNIKEKQSIVENAKFDVKNSETVYMGSGWGAIQNMISEKPVSNIVSFPKESITEVENEWVQLYNDGVLPVPDPKERIKSYVTGEIWRKKLEEAEDSWYKFYQLGVTTYALGKSKEAYELFKKSNELCENAWALRNMAQLEKNEFDDIDNAIEHMAAAVTLVDDYQPLWVNYAEALIARADYEKWLESYEKLSDTLKDNGRLKMLYALSLTNTDRYKETFDILTEDFVMPDIKEGEFSISHIWLESYRKLMIENGEEDVSDAAVFAKYPLPYKLDFRMHG